MWLYQHSHKCNPATAACLVIGGESTVNEHQDKKERDKSRIKVEEVAPSEGFGPSTDWFLSSLMSDWLRSMSDWLTASRSTGLSHDGTSHCILHF
jgi:hypothetical protein